MDKRIAEKDHTLSDADRYLFRLQRERTNRQKHASRFSLLDHTDYDEQGEAGANPSGAAPFLPGVDESPLPSDDEQDADEEALFTRKEGTSDDARTAQGEQSAAPGNAMGSGNEADDAPRTRREIMDEVMQKSKSFKAQRQWEKHETDEQTARLDSGLPEIMRLLTQAEAEVAPDPAPALTLPSALKKKVPQAEPVEAAVSSSKAFEYDSVYRMLASEKRARPTDRMLTEEETAEKERDRLVELENLRKRRMQSIDDDQPVVDASNKRKSHVRKGADDLDDGFEHDSDSDVIPVEDQGDALEEDVASDAESDHDKPVGCASSFWNSFSAADVVATKAETQEVPFVYSKCPANVMELQALLKCTTAAQRGDILDRVSKCFAISLDSGRNPRRLERLLECMLFWMERLVEVDSTHIASVVEELDVLLVRVHSFGNTFERTISSWGRALVLKCSKKLEDGDKGLATCWDVSDILLLRCVARLFPSSDLRHGVSTPLALLLSEALGMFRVKCVADVALGTFVGRVLMEVIGGRSGYSPELARFLGDVLSASSELSEEDEQKEDVGLGNVFRRVEDVSECEPLRLSDCKLLISGEEASVSLAGSVLLATASLTEALFDDWLVHADLVFAHTTLRHIPVRSIRMRMCALLADCGKGREALTLYAKRERKVLKMLNPKMRSTESGVYHKRGKTRIGGGEDVDEKSMAVKRVRRALRKEVRGMTRDVRKDAADNASIWFEEERVRRERADAKDKEVRLFMETQQSTWRAAEKKQKKLSGKQW